MGLKTASTSFCRKLTVLTFKDDVYSVRQWDLDIIADQNSWILLEPDLEDYSDKIEYLDKLREGRGGTIVIWENIDRLVRSNNEGTSKDQLKKIAADLGEHLSGVFYNFLSGCEGFKKISIQVNKNNIEPWDPFCRWLNENQKGRVEIHKNKPFNITETINGRDEVIGTFYVNIYILPNKNELTQAELERMRYGLDYQGFHVFREGRMIYSGGWPNRLFVKEPHLNLIRVELLFDHKLDHYFQIDIKKSRIDLPKDLKEQLKRVVAPARNEANRRYRNGGNNSQRSDGNLLNDQHGKSSIAIEKQYEGATTGSVVESANKSKGEAEIINKFGKTTVKISFDYNINRLVESKDNLEDGVLWMPGLVDGNRHAVFLNKSHEFYKKFYLANKESFEPLS